MNVQVVTSHSNLYSDNESIIASRKNVGYFNDNVYLVLELLPISSCVSFSSYEIISILSTCGSDYHFLFLGERRGQG